MPPQPLQVTVYTFLSGASVQSHNYNAPVRIRRGLHAGATVAALRAELDRRLPRPVLSLYPYEGNFDKLAPSTALTDEQLLGELLPSPGHDSVTLLCKVGRDVMERAPLAGCTWAWRCCCCCCWARAAC
jgi:hypothetical protein